MMTKPLLIVIDDEPDMAEYFAYVGETVGFDIEVTTNGIEFQEICSKRKPDAIVMDIVMPNMDGNELIDWLIMKGCDAPIILISGYGDKYLPMSKELGLGRGAKIVDTLTKPVSLEVLETVFKKILPET